MLFSLCSPTLNPSSISLCLALTKSNLLTGRGFMQSITVYIESCSRSLCRAKIFEEYSIDGGGGEQKCQTGMPLLFLGG